MRNYPLKPTNGLNGAPSEIRSEIRRRTVEGAPSVQVPVPAPFPKMGRTLVLATLVDHDLFVDRLRLGRGDRRRRCVAGQHRGWVRLRGRWLHGWCYGRRRFEDKRRGFANG